MPSSFGGVIPVTSLNLGFPGNISRSTVPIIAARQVLPTTATAISFGQTCVIVPDSSNGTIQSVADFIVGGGTFTASLFAGIAVRNVKTTLAYTSFFTLGAGLSGNFAPGEIADCLELGSCTVNCNVGQPISQNPVFIRIAANGAIPNGVIGGLEAVADGANTVSLASLGVVFRTGVLDANGVCEITLKNRVQA